MDAGTILFSSSASKLVKTPPWEKKTVLNFDSVAATSVPHQNLVSQHISRFDTVRRQSATSGFRTSERPSSRSSTIVQRANVPPAAPIASPENKDKSFPNKSASEVKHSSEQHKTTISQYQNRHGARIPSTLPAKIQQPVTRTPVEVQDPRKVTHSSKLSHGAIITKPKPSSGITTSSGSGSVSGTKTVPGNPSPVYSSLATTGTTVSSMSKSSSSALESSTGVTSKTKSGISISNAHKSTESSPYHESNTSPNQRFSRSQVQSQVLGNKVRHGSDASSSPADHNKRYTIPKMKTAATITSTTSTVSHTSSNKAISTMPKKSDSAAVAETTSNQCFKTTATTTGTYTGISKAMITMQKKPDSTVVKSASIKSTATSTVVSTGASDMVSGDLLGTILPTLPCNSSNRLPGSTSETKSDSKDTRSTSHTPVKSSESLGTKPKPPLGRHERSRHSSGAGSGGSASPLYTEKSPSDRETAKSTSISKTTLGIKEKNAVYDPRLNCVPLPSMRYSKSSEKQPTKERQRPNSSTQEQSGTNKSLKAANKPGIRSSSSVTKPPAKIQQPTTRTPVEIQDPRKVTHDSKLSQGALKIKPILGFRIPKQKTVSVSEDSADELSDEKMKNSGARKSPKKKKKNHKKDKDEKGVSTASKSSNEIKDRSSKHGELKGHASDKMSCELISSGNTVVEHLKKTSKPSSVTKTSTAENTKTGER